jgi:hypothetical protein
MANASQASVKEAKHFSTNFIFPRNKPSPPKTHIFNQNIIVQVSISFFLKIA